MLARIQAALAPALRGPLTVAVLLLIPAGLIPGGTWLWSRGLELVGAFALVTTVGNVALACLRPEHFQVRQQSVVASKEKRQPLLDAVGSVGLLAFGAAWLVFIPTDVFALRLLPQPSELISVIGGICAVVGAALTPLAVWENRFATPNVQDQGGQGQRVVDTGIYGLIRHPIYAGNLLLAGGAPLWLGSYAAAAIGGAVLLAMTVGRIVIEEAHLRANVPGYADYAHRVRGRLIPFVL
ncbi:MAG TPA: isoprenylcysteine carboxylmethyltransferase family protein [Caulobacteraceae bacterium]|jgi:protein-S-isoprenylcysteine O-methyltransferase Ste14